MLVSEPCVPVVLSVNSFSPVKERITGYDNFGIDDSAGSKIGIRKELIVLNIFKYKYCVDCVNFARYRKLLTNWWPV